MKYMMIVVPLLCFVHSLSRPVCAQEAAPPPNPPQQAVDLFQAGRQALANNDVEGALKLFEQSLALNKSGGVLLNLADCEQRLGRLASALRHYREVARLLPETDIRVPPAKKEIAALEPRVPTLRVHLDRSAPSGTVVMVDGGPLEASGVEGELVVDAKQHVVSVRAQGHEPRDYELTLTEGEKREITVSPGRKLVPEPASPAPASPGTHLAPAVSRPAPSMSPLRIGSFVSLGVGTVAVIAGAATGGAAIATRSELGQQCSGPDGSVCSGSAAPLITQGKALADGSTALFIAGGVALASGVGLLVVDYAMNRKGRHVGVRVGAGQVTIGGSL